MMSTLSRPQRPHSAPGDAGLWLLYGVHPSHIWSSSFPAAFPFPCVNVFSKEPRLLMTGPKWDSFSFVLFRLQRCFRLSFLWEPLVPFPGSLGICSDLLQHHPSNESVFSSYQPSSLSSFHLCTQYWDYEVMGDLSFGL